MGKYSGGYCCVDGLPLSTVCKSVVFIKSCNRISGEDTGKLPGGLKSMFSTLTSLITYRKVLGLNHIFF